MGWRLRLKLSHDNRRIFYGMAFGEGAFGIYQTLWPLYIAALGATPPQVGFVMGIVGVSRLFTLIPSGILADHIPPRAIMVTGRTLTDPDSNVTSYTYDALNRVTTITDALSQDTTFAYDANSNLTSITDANSHATSYTYDALNRVTAVTDALSRATTYTYDAVGNVTQTEDGNGVTNRLVYDTAGRLTGVDLNNDSSLDIEYAYDDAGRRTSMVDGTGTTTYSYDNANRLTSVAAPTTGTVSYGYDDADERTSLTYPDSHAVTYTYTDLGQLETVSDWLSHITTYSYDDAGRLTGIADPNAVDGTLTYDNANRLTGISYDHSGTGLESLSYTLDPAGIVTQLVDSSGTTSYSYDDLYRLTEVDYPNSDVVSYGYDAVGNRTSLTINGTTTTNTFDNANELTASGSDSYSYDDNGNLTSKTVGGTTTTYGYDELNQLTSISGPTSASYVYNGDGLRVSKTVSSTTTDYTWDQTGIGQVINDGNEYVWGLGLISQIASGTPTYAHSDGLGSTRLLTDGSGSVVGTQQYDAFGATRTQTGTQLPFTYTGEQVDPESGLVYLRNRYLDPATGRFQTPDPLGFFGSGVNLYAYVGNSPATVTDPSGLACPECPGGGGGGVGGGGAGAGSGAGASAGDVASPGGDAGDSGDASTGSDAALGDAAKQECPQDRGPGGGAAGTGSAEPSAQGSNGSEAQSNSSDNLGKTSGKTITRPGMGLGPQGTYPPGYDPDTWTSGPSSRTSLAKAGQLSWYDPDSGEWTFHPEDQYHPGGDHWDYKAPGNPNIPWDNIYPK